MSNATAIRVGPSRRILAKSFPASRPHAPHAEWAPAPKLTPEPRRWKMVTSPALAWAMVQILVESGAPTGPDPK